MSDIDGTKVMNNLSESEIERLTRVAAWAFDKGRDFTNNPTILETLASIDWRKPNAINKNIMCLNCYAALIKGETE